LIWMYFPDILSLTGFPNRPIIQDVDILFRLK
jgi:hypothetical protein